MEHTERSNTMKQHRQILSFFAILISLLCGSATHAITSGELLDTANKAEVVFLTSVADPASEPYLNVFDNDVLIKIVFDDGVSSEDEIAVEFADEGGVSGVYTLNQVVAMINTETQALGFTPDGINKNYDMADVAENSDGSYSLRLRSQFTATSQTIRYGNATAGQDARMEGVFGDVSCADDDSFTQINAMMYYAAQKICGHYLGELTCTPHLSETFTATVPRETYDSAQYLKVIDNDVMIKIQFTNSSGIPEEELAIVFSDEGGSGGVYTLIDVINAINSASQNLSSGAYDMAELVWDDLWTGLTLKISSLGASDGFILRYGNATAGYDASIEGVFGNLTCASDDSFTDVDASQYTPSSVCGFYINFGVFANLASAWGADISSENWNYQCDYDCSDRIDEADLMILIRDWGTFVDY